MRNEISVIMPTYNSEKWIARSVECIIRQSYKKFELIIVDDGSTDTTQNICLALQASDNRIHYFRTTNSGAASARNFGLEHATGEYICFVDADDVVSEHYLEYLLKTIEGTDLAICNFSIADNQNESLFVGEFTRHCEPQLDVFKEMLRLVDNPQQSCEGYLWNKMFKRRIIDLGQIRFKQFRMWEDMLFCCEYVGLIRESMRTRATLYSYTINNSDSVSSGLTNVDYRSWLDAAQCVRTEVISVQPEVSGALDGVIANIAMMCLISAIVENTEIESRTLILIKNGFGGLRRQYKLYYFLYRLNRSVFTKIIQIFEKEK
ncbi:glycosyltransferase family 2 protein [Lacticaseibacillus porcinae]|uniref:glycosyltransferase family 2 protein n=1 Tax=Lacticaseibacillus porcinae TaxID=1123687 RepID=UPI000F7AED96|nr:glycosyltransferase family 2 protein [Lacticaseibacillus porcinae]